MTFWQEFKKFAVKGNMIDLAVAVVIGTAFNEIVNSLVKNIITPPLGYFTSGVELSALSYELAAGETGADGEVADPVLIEYGIFLQSLIDFLIIAFTIFVVVKFINRMKERAEDSKDKTVPTPKDIALLSEIRDELKQLNSEKSAAKIKEV